MTFNDIQNAIFALRGYLDIGKEMSDDTSVISLITKEEELIQRITRSLDFSRSYQDLGVHSPKWQPLNQVFIVAISHLDFTTITRDIRVKEVEIFADPLLEQVFTALSDNILRHGVNAKNLAFFYEEKMDGLLLIFEDDGIGIPPDKKETIFERGFGSQKGMSLFLVREILSITGITIRESGIYEEGARFEMIIPKGVYRIISE